MRRLVGECRHIGWYPDANFKISLSERSGHTAAVDLALADGTAKAFSDYDPAAGTATFAPGETQNTFTIKVIGDTIVEPDETIFVNLSVPSGPGP